MDVSIHIEFVPLPAFKAASTPINKAAYTGISSNKLFESRTAVDRLSFFSVEAVDTLGGHVSTIGREPPAPQN